MERWVVVAIVALLCLAMLVRPQTLTFWRIHRTPAKLAATRAIGGIGLLCIAIVVASYFVH